jgi:hypothetical protein
VYSNIRKWFLCNEEKTGLIMENIIIGYPTPFSQNTGKRKRMKILLIFNKFPEALQKYLES